MYIHISSDLEACQTNSPLTSTFAISLQLLSSLASDLDTMLNDLRSAPSHAATSIAAAAAATSNQQQQQQQHQLQQQHHLHNQQQMQSRQLQAHHWQSINNNKNNNISNNNNNNNINNNNNNNNLPHPPCLIDIKLKSSRSAATTLTSTATTATATSNQLQQRRRVAPKPLPRPPRRSRPSGQKEAGPVVMVAADEEDGDTDASDLANMTSPLSASAAATRINGLSPEVKKVQRLPLWHGRNGGNGSTTHTHTHCHPTNASVQRRLPIQSHQQRILTHRVHHHRPQHG